MGLVKRALRGAAAGVAGTVVMDAVTTILYERQSAAVTERETAAMHGGKGAAEISAIKTARAIGVELTDDQSKLGASLFHWAIGVLPAAPSTGSWAIDSAASARRGASSSGWACS